jgi:hypothetical protein
MSINSPSIVNVDEIQALYQQYEELGNRIKTLEVLKIKPLPPLPQSIANIEVKEVMKSLLAKEYPSSLNNPPTQVQVRPKAKSTVRPKAKSTVRPKAKSTVRPKTKKAKSSMKKRKIGTNKRKIKSSRPAMKYKKRDTSQAKKVKTASKMRTFRAMLKPSKTLHQDNPTYSEFVKQLRTTRTEQNKPKASITTHTNEQNQLYNWNGEKWVLS